MKRKKQIPLKLLVSSLAACFIFNTVTISPVFANTSEKANPERVIPQVETTAGNAGNSSPNNNDVLPSNAHCNDPVKVPNDSVKTAEKRKSIAVQTMLDLPVSSKTFNVALAGATIPEEDTLVYSDVASDIADIPTASGIWIPKNQRSQILKLINTYSSLQFVTNNDGYLRTDVKAAENTTESKTFAEKINTLISGKERVILALSDSFWSYDDQAFRLSKKNIIDTASVSFKFNQSRLVILNSQSFCVSAESSSAQAILLLNQIFKDGTDYSAKIISEIKADSKLPDKPTDSSSSVPANSKGLTSSTVSSSKTNSSSSSSDPNVSSEAMGSYLSNSKQVSSSFSGSYNSQNKTSTVPSTASDISKSSSSNSSSSKVSEPPSESGTQSNSINSTPLDSQSTSSSNTSSEEYDDTSGKNNQTSYSAFDVALAGLFCKTGNSLAPDNFKSNLKSIPSKNGVWIPSAYRKGMLSLINEASAKPFSIDADGYLKLKSGATANLGKSSMITDKLILLIQGNQRIILAPTKKIWGYNSKGSVFFASTFGDTYSVQFQSQSSRLILLNSSLFKKYNYETNNIIVSALLFDQLFNDGIDYSAIIKVPHTFSLLSINAIAASGTMKSAQTTYMGPGNSSIYAKAGSVDSGESVSVINTEQGWIYIEYNTSNGRKRGYVPSGSVSYSGSLPTVNYLGGYYNATTGERSIYYLSSATGLTVGTVYGYEGITVLTTYGGVSFIEYSSSSGTKRGYVANSQLATRHDGIVGVVTASNAPVYSGTDTGFYRVGSISRTEYAVLLKDNGTWTFVEYNTPSGRKRGYILLSNITNHNSTSAIPNIFITRNLGIANADLTAYCGPNSNYAKLGSVFNGDQVNIITANEYGWCFVEYYTGNHASKRGYVDINHIREISLNSIPAPSGGSLITYGTSAEGISLNAYKLGTGPNVLFAVFAQHGFEDGWAADGIELVKVANNLISELKGNGNLLKWTIYVIPSANPDGLLNGCTNNGYGRCTFYGYDMNRSHNTSPLANYSDSRNMTNHNAAEVVDLENFIKSRKSSAGQNVLLDVHGWENSTLGDPTISKYFGNALGLRHVSDSGSTGYLITWGSQNDIASVLVEFPLAANAAALANLNVSGKFNSAVNSLLKNTGYNNAKTSNVIGYLDKVSGDCIRGWARDNNNLADTIYVDTYVKNSSGHTVFSKRVVANKYRSDVAPGSHGYRLDMDWRPFVPGTYKVYSYGIGKNGNNPLLTNSPKTYTVSASSGCVDYVNKSGIGGWVWKSAAPNLPIKVNILVLNSLGDNIFSTSVEANQYRSDLKKLGYGNGYHGFSCKIDWDKLPQGKLKIIVYAVDESGNCPKIRALDYINNVKHKTVKTNSDSNVNSGYNRSAAYNYMIKYGDYGPGYSRNSRYANFDSDCTDFASQILADTTAGNLSQIGKYPDDIKTDINCWYYTYFVKAEWSNTWSFAKEFREHWAGLNGANMHAYKYVEYNTVDDAINDYDYLYKTLQVGDIIQVINTSGDAHHTMIVEYFDPDKRTILYAQHSGDPGDGKDLNLLERMKYWKTSSKSDCKDNKVGFILIKK